MNDSNNQTTLTQPFVSLLNPSGLIEPEGTTINNSDSEILSILNPNSLGTVLTIGDFSGLPGTTLTVPIAISDAEGVQSLTINLTYDTSLLNIIDPDTDTDENEGIRRAGISSDWTLDPNNPVANVNEDTGEVSISLVNTQELPDADSSGTILEIDFEIDADAELGNVADIDLQNARVGVSDRDIALGNSNLDDGTVSIGDGSTIELFRFRNTSFDTGTYVFVGATERDAILANPDFNQTFSLDGVQNDGSVNAAFTASTTPGADLIPFFRLESLATAGTFLFVSTAEYDQIFADDSDQRDQWLQQGVDGDGNDIPEFYLLDGSADSGLEFNRFQNTQNNTFLYAGPSETDAIANDQNLSTLFNNQGVAFESLI